MKIVHSLTMLLYSAYQQYQLTLSASFFLQTWCCTGNIHIFVSSQYAILQANNIVSECNCFITNAKLKKINATIYGKQKQKY